MKKMFSRIASLAVSLSLVFVLASAGAIGIVGIQAATPVDSGIIQHAEAKVKLGAKGYYSKRYGYNPSTLIGNEHWAEIISYKKGILRLQIGYINSSYMTYTGNLKIKIKKKSGTFKYRDSFGYRGKGSVKLGKGWVKVKLKTTSAPGRGMLTTEGKWIKLKKV